MSGEYQDQQDAQVEELKRWIESTFEYVKDEYLDDYEDIDDLEGSLYEVLIDNEATLQTLNSNYNYYGQPPRVVSIQAHDVPDFRSAKLLAFAIAALLDFFRTWDKDRADGVAGAGSDWENEDVFGKMGIFDDSDDDRGRRDDSGDGDDGDDGDDYDGDDYDGDDYDGDGDGDDDDDESKTIEELIQELARLSGLDEMYLGQNGHPMVPNGTFAFAKYLFDFPGDGGAGSLHEYHHPPQQGFQGQVVGGWGVYGPMHTTGGSIKRRSRKTKKTKKIKTRKTRKTRKTKKRKKRKTRRT